MLAQNNIGSRQYLSKLNSLYQMIGSGFGYLQQFQLLTIDFRFRSRFLVSAIDFPFQVMGYTGRDYTFYF